MEGLWIHSYLVCGNVFRLNRWIRNRSKHSYPDTEKTTPPLFVGREYGGISKLDFSGKWLRSVWPKKCQGSCTVREGGVPETSADRGNKRKGNKFIVSVTGTELVWLITCCVSCVGQGGRTGKDRVKGGKPCNIMNEQIVENRRRWTYFWGSDLHNESHLGCMDRVPSLRYL